MEQHLRLLEMKWFQLYEWYANLYDTNQPHVNQADINATFEGILSHEVGHGATIWE